MDVFVTDSARDFWDWVTVGGGVLFGLASVVVGILAVILARKANMAAERANAEASKARAAVAIERRRTFELEILRDLLEALDQPTWLGEVIEFRRSFEGTFGARLSLLPVDELPAWRAVVAIRKMEGLVDLVGRTAEDEEALEQNRTLGVRFAPPSLRGRLRSRLRLDVEEAVERRMVERDD
ncbi:hypothetical protein [Micromonospora costi]|uniref:Uncharacterized protein n=1 Tax=Micromonospora costi TaxID=1530042 RepID=A0A3B0AA81_9ACTN|nr:hypothetical protein [Micromonospora costi]RKN55967.1 hypothetical protein D7193_15385 [Micromonospora costi]